uniref:F-box domain-containing protein n=1 Tax=Colletotrichum fructicola (strain Nara gc5) TaxID=1213859 RepID=L2FVA3_COLFN
MWGLLPSELRLQILEYLLALKPERLAPYTTFCRPWQHRIEPILFEEVTLYVTTANILSGKTTPSTLADIIRGPRIQDLKKLSIVIDLIRQVSPSSRMARGAKCNSALPLRMSSTAPSTRYVAGDATKYMSILRSTRSDHAAIT